MKKNRSFLSSYAAKTAFVLLITSSVFGCSSNVVKHPTDHPTERSTQRSTQHSTDKPWLVSPLVCNNAKRFNAQVVGDGHCVSLIKTCSGAPSTDQWQAGRAVYSSPENSIQPGTVIATFVNGKYPNKTGWHAAIYISHNQHGIWVWDQWRGKPVHKRLIRYRKDGASAGNTAQEYRVVTLLDHYTLRPLH